MPGKTVKGISLGTIRGLHQVVHINPAVEIQATCQRFKRCQPFVRVYLLERHRLTHDVGLDVYKRQKETM